MNKCKLKGLGTQLKVKVLHSITNTTKKNFFKSININLKQMLSEHPKKY